MLINISENKKQKKETKERNKKKHQNIMIHGNNLNIFRSYIGHGFGRYLNMQFLICA